LTQKKQRPGGHGAPVRGARSAPATGAAGKQPAGREVVPGWTARQKSEEMLGRLGLETALEAVDRLGNTAESRALRAWLNTDPAEVCRLLRMLPSGSVGGTNREMRVRLCGVAFVARRKGQTVAARRGCKDRCCPTCSARRSRIIAARLREHVRAVKRRHDWHSRRGERRPSRIVFMTCTRPKVAGETPRAAIDAILADWRRFTERTGKALLVGGMRSLEVTARRAGAVVGEHVVRYGGTHAHIHAVMEVAPGVGAGDLKAAWCAACNGAEAWCQDVQPLDTDEAIYQACKYPVDLSGLLDVLEAAPGYVAGVVQALHGRRTVAMFGAWRGVQLAREAEGDLVFGDRSIETLATSDWTEAPPVRWSDGTEQPAEDVLRELLEGALRRDCTTGG